MKNRPRNSFFLLTLAITMCFASCEKYDHAIADIEDRLDKMEGIKINTIEQQITNINTSLTDLKSMDAALQTLIDGLETEAANLKTELDANAEADAATKKDLEEKIATLETLIATLQTKDTELDKKIADLETFVNDEITATEDWANATFATLEQYEYLQMWIEAIKVAISNLEKWNDETDNMIGMLVADFQKIIANNETSMKEWVNEVLADGYYTKAEIDGKITALQTKVAEGDAELQKEIDELETALEQAKTDLTKAYEKAIADAVANGGVINKAIADAIADAKEALQSQINAINSDIEKIEDRLSALETDFANRIQSLTYIPTHTDGKATMAYNATSGKMEAELSFFVTPKSVVGNIKQEHLSAKGVYTAATRAVDLKDLSVTAFDSDTDNGTITVTVSGNNLTDFLNGTSDAAVFLIISDGNSEFVSDYVPLAMGQTYTYDQASNTYTVYTAMGLYAWNKALETDLATNLVLAADITLPNKDLSTREEITVTDGQPSGSNWNPYGYYDNNAYGFTMYNGAIDGGGHTISGMRIYTNEHTGFVKVLSERGSIKNLVIDDVVIYSTNIAVAALAGYNYGIIENCHVKGETSSIYGTYDVGGIAGYMNNKHGDAEIIACSNMATVTPASYVGGYYYGGIVATVSNMSGSNLNVIGCWTKDTNEAYGTKDGIGINNGATTAGVFSFSDAIAANSKITEMNQALEDAGYSYRWEAVAGGWPVVKP